ncbi:MAG TPA: WYL domain-containing protein [Verrucomicrobiota bacterium]|nr:WYL domain-containing protein [Verrucomicrobiota bacterium]HQL80467.1 WYL domain-containing protein [Verrucomicrobiota bacterium]
MKTQQRPLRRTQPPGARRNPLKPASRPATPGPVKRRPLGRMKKILGLLQDGKYPNCNTIATELEISSRTVARDLDCMRDDLELPVDYDKQRHGYYLTEPVQSLPIVPVSSRELFAVCVAHKALEHYRGTALEKPLELAFKRFAERLDDDERFTLQSLDEVLSLRPFAPEDADLKLFELVTGALTDRHALRFQYRKPGQRRTELRRVHPYHLFEFGHRWYLLAYDLKRRDLRTFVLGRMREAAATREKFQLPPGFDPRKHFETSLGVMSGKGDYRVAVEMDAWLTDILRGRRWHPSQQITEFPDGRSQLRLRLSCLEEIEQYILSWGAHAIVLDPPELRQRLLRTTRELARRYAHPAAGVCQSAPAALPAGAGIKP